MLFSKEKMHVPGVQSLLYVASMFKYGEGILNATTDMEMLRLRLHTGLCVNAFPVLGQSACNLQRFASIYRPQTPRETFAPTPNRIKSNISPWPLQVASFAL